MWLASCHLVTSPGCPDQIVHASTSPAGTHGHDWVSGEGCYRNACDVASAGDMQPPACPSACPGRAGGAWLAPGAAARPDNAARHGSCSSSRSLAPLSAVSACFRTAWASASACSAASSLRRQAGTLVHRLTTPPRSHQAVEHARRPGPATGDPTSSPGHQPLYLIAPR